ncbi:hypothetical protein HU200_027964 [Digitaria exilis]|uniref:Uncharacterized protein n=1 Tax=Digitaria exilis TaxID=1010633 RepID=A0A835BVI9_9POAL|nr:hypothetical protein HU200_027964 [Digitaria exilis]
MAGFIAVVAEMVGAAVVQEAVSGAISLVLGKRKEKASQVEYLERLRKAVNVVEFVLERTAKLPITEVSLLREKIELKREFSDTAASLLTSRRKKRLDTSQVIRAACSLCSKRRFKIRSALLEDHGVEAVVIYWYSDYIRPDKSFFVKFVLRLSESTDIVGISINCLQSMASQFNLVTDTATGELTLLANSQDISYSYAPPWGNIQEADSKYTHLFRPDPLCCKAKGHTPCANNKVVVSSHISQAFPEEVIVFGFSCYTSAPEYYLRSLVNARGKRSVMRNRRRPPIELSVCVAPHDYGKQHESYAYERIGDNGERIDLSIQVIQEQVGEIVRLRAINCFLRQPKVTEYSIFWMTKYGGALFIVKKLSACAQVPTWVKCFNGDQ